MNTYLSANLTESGYVGTVTADPDGLCPLHESARVWPTPDEAEEWAWHEWLDIVRSALAA